MPDVEVNVTETPPASVIVEESSGATVSVDIPPAAQVVEVSIPGPQGPPGPPGELGSDAYYVHAQDTPLAVWEYEHGLGKNPAVRTFASDGVEWEGDVTYPEDNVSVRIEWGGAMSGVAYNN